MLGSPIPGSLTGTRPWPVKNWVAEHARSQVTHVPAQARLLLSPSAEAFPPLRTHCAHFYFGCDGNRAGGVVCVLTRVPKEKPPSCACLEKKPHGVTKLVPRGEKVCDSCLNVLFFSYLKFLF